MSKPLDTEGLPVSEKTNEDKLSKKARKPFKIGRAKKKDGDKIFKKPSKKRIVLIVVLVIAVVIGVILFIRSRATQAASSTQTYATTPIELTALETTVLASGTITSTTSVQVNAPAVLEILAVPVKDGQTVAAGEQLAVLDLSSIERDIKNAELSKQNSEASLSEANRTKNNNVRTARDSLKSSAADLKTAQTDYTKAKNKLDAQTVAATSDEMGVVDVALEAEAAAANAAIDEYDRLATEVVNAKLAYDQAQRSYDDLLAQSGGTSTVLQAQLSLEEAQLAYDQAVSGYSTTNSVATAQITLQSAQQAYTTAVAQANNSVYSARIDMDTASNNLTNAENNRNNPPTATATDGTTTTDSSTSLETAYLNASNTYDKAVITYNNALVSRDNSIASAQQTVDKAQLAYDDAKKGGTDTVTSTKTKLENAQITYDESVRNSGESLKTSQESLEKAKVAYEAALEAQEDSYATAETALQKSQLSYQTAQNNLSYASSSSTLSSQISIEQQEITMESLQLDLESAQMRAPVAGTITYVNADIGASASGLMFVIEDIDSLEVLTTVSELEVSSIEVGQKVRVETDTMNGETVMGEVSNVASAAQKATDGSTSTSTNVVFEVTVKITGNDPRMKIGMNATMSIITEEKTDVLAVPIEAVTEINEKSYITILEGGAPAMSQNNAQGNGRPAQSPGNSPAIEEITEPNAQGAPESSPQQQAPSDRTKQSGAAAEGTEEQTTRQIEVTTGMESDTMIEISSPDIYEGMLVVTGSSAGGASSAAMMGNGGNGGIMIDTGSGGPSGGGGGGPRGG